MQQILILSWVFRSLLWMTLVNMVPLWARGHYSELIDKLQRYSSDILHASIVWVN